MANIYLDKETVAPVGVSGIREYIGPVTLSVTHTINGSDAEYSDNFPMGLNAEALVGSVLLVHGEKHIIVAALDEDDVIHSYGEGEPTTNVGDVTYFGFHIAVGSIEAGPHLEDVVLIYSRDLGRVFETIADLADYINSTENTSGD